MPRPEGGYKNLAGEKVPGVHDITKRYADKGGLMHWIHQEGLKGNRNPYASAADIGTVVHAMCELDLRGAPDRQIEAIPHQKLSIPADVDQVWQSFRAFKTWRFHHRVHAIAFEESIVSERFQYGGTFDCIAWVDGVRTLLDFKTCKDASRVFLEQRLVMAAHGHLWHEKYPRLPLHAYHLINLPKDGSEPGHHAFADLSVEWEMFALQLDCWKLEKGITRKRTTKPKTIVQSPQAKLKEELAAFAAAQCDDVHCHPDVVVLERVREQLAAKPRRVRKPKLTVVGTPTAASPPRSLSMAEIMRANGWVPPC